ncbi:MAG: hypothetical protein SNH13_00425 [Rikenellaceae bacterium]
MSYIESTKSYTGSQLESIFFKPMFTGGSAAELGIKVLYNMPIPTSIGVWGGDANILKGLGTAGWNGSQDVERKSKTIDMKCVKAEQGFSAADYYSMVYESMVLRSDTNFEDISGTELEAAETDLFRASISEAVRATMWIGDTQREGEFNTFDGLLKMIMERSDDGLITTSTFTQGSADSPAYTAALFKTLWNASSAKLQGLKSSGELVIFVTTDIYNHYELYLDSQGVDSSYIEQTTGRPKLMYHGMEVIDMQVSGYLADFDSDDLAAPYAFITDRRNLVMAVNTSDYPGSEIRMWYNPDEMQNRQRATFAIGCEIIDEELISLGVPAVVEDSNA